MSETCQACGRRYDLVWTADDEFWKAMIGTEAGLRCPDCFDALCRDRGVFLRWVPRSL